MKYTSILRGINVSGQKKIKMADLKSLYEKLGFENIITYIQSGNVIFDSDITSDQDLIAQIEKAIEKQYGFFVPVDLRIKSDLEQIITQCPFDEAQDENYLTKVLVIFLDKEPEQKRVDDLVSYVKSPEKLVVIGKQVYLLCPNGYGRSKLTNTFIEKKLNRCATTRNWKSVNKLNELME